VLAVPLPNELAGGPPDAALLARVAEITGGRVLAAPGDARWPGDGPRRVWWPLVLAAFALVAADALVRVLTPPPARPERALVERRLRGAGPPSPGEDASVDERAR
jgi:hypothetical protein